MPPTPRPTRSWNNRLMEAVCESLPNCSKAMALVQAGCERDLALRERVALKYHGRLCPFCACATGKFEAARALMKEAEEQRKQDRAGNAGNP